jgi:hypothetical protein
MTHNSGLTETDISENKIDAVSNKILNFFYFYKHYK